MLDGRRNIYNADGGKELAWSIPLRAYITIDGEKISTPDSKSARVVGRPGGESFDIVFTTYASARDCAFLQRKVYVYGLDLEDENAGHIFIWPKDVKECVQRKARGIGEDVMAVIRYYASDVQSALKMAYTFTIEASPARVAISNGVVQGLKKIFASGSKSGRDSP